MIPLEATFEERPNRFFVHVRLDGRKTACHLPNPGRLREFLRPGATVLLRPEARPYRKTAYDLIAVRKGDVLVSLDTRLPNKAVRRWLAEERLPEFAGYRTVVPEVALGASRVDFLLQDGRPCYLEVKSCTLVKEGTALFPDAPTLRGQRHLATLTNVVGEGSRAIILFVVQRPDAHRFRPHDRADPAFGNALREAEARGVEVYAYRSRFDGKTLVEPTPIQTNLGPV